MFLAGDDDERRQRIRRRVDERVVADFRASLRTCRRLFCGAHAGAPCANSNDAMDCAYGGRNTPDSVTNAETSFPGVTSNAGLKALAPAGATRTPANASTSVGSRCSKLISSPDAMPRSNVECGAATYSGIE